MSQKGVVTPSALLTTGKRKQSIWTKDALSDVRTGGVTYMAHIGGFLLGAVTARLFEDPRRIAEQQWKG